MSNNTDRKESSSSYFHSSPPHRPFEGIPVFAFKGFAWSHCLAFCGIDIDQDKSPLTKKRINDGYKRAALMMHPDKCSASPQQSEFATRMFQKLKDCRIELLNQVDLAERNYLASSALSSHNNTSRYVYKPPPGSERFTLRPTKRQAPPTQQEEASSTFFTENKRSKHGDGEPPQTFPRPFPHPWPPSPPQQQQQQQPTPQQPPFPSPLQQQPSPQQQQPFRQQPPFPSPLQQQQPPSPQQPAPQPTPQQQPFRQQPPFPSPLLQQQQPSPQQQQQQQPHKPKPEDEKEEDRKSSVKLYRSNLEADLSVMQNRTEAVFKKYDSNFNAAFVVTAAPTAGAAEGGGGAAATHIHNNDHINDHSKKIIIGTFFDLVKREEQSIINSRPLTFGKRKPSDIIDLPSRLKDEFVSLLMESLTSNSVFIIIKSSLQGVAKNRIHPLLNDFMPKGELGRKATYLRQQNALQKMKSLIKSQTLPLVDKLIQQNDTKFKPLIRTVVQHLGTIEKQYLEDNHNKQLAATLAKEAADASVAAYAAMVAIRNAEESMNAKKKLLGEQQAPSTDFWDHQRCSHQSFFFNDGDDDVFNLQRDIQLYEKQVQESTQEYDRRKKEEEDKKNESDRLLKTIAENKAKKSALLAELQTIVGSVHTLMLEHKNLIASIHHDISTLCFDCKHELLNKHR